MQVWIWVYLNIKIFLPLFSIKKDHFSLNSSMITEDHRPYILQRETNIMRSIKKFLGLPFLFLSLNLRASCPYRFVFYSLFWSLFTSPPTLHATSLNPPWENSEELKVKWGGFVDTYYTYDLNRPPHSARNPKDYNFTSQAARHNEFNVNLAYFEVTGKAEKVRGRLALQYGTSVPIGYSMTGKESSSLNTLQEAFAGYRLASGWWLDGGVFFSHIGFESWISKNNWNYTRSLILDQVPYFQTGVRLSYDQNGPWSFQIHLLNGWSTILNSNQSRALGLHLEYRVHPQLTLSYNQFYGLVLNQMPRLYQEIYATLQISEKWSVLGAVEFGLQKINPQDWAQWGSAELLTRYEITPRFSLAYRLEAFIDPKGITQQTSTPHGYTLTSTSFGFNSQLSPQLLWRGEVRGYLSPDPLFKTRGPNSRQDASLTTSLSLSL